MISSLDTAPVFEKTFGHVEKSTRIKEPFDPADKTAWTKAKDVKKIN